MFCLGITVGRVEDFNFLILIARNMAMFFVHSRVGMNEKQLANLASPKVVALFEKCVFAFLPSAKGALWHL